MVLKRNSSDCDDFVRSMLKKAQEDNKPRASALHNNVNVEEVQELTRNILNNTSAKKRKY